MPSLPDLTPLVNLFRLFVAFLGAYLFAVWVAMIIWTYRDIHARSRDIFAQGLAVLLVLIFNVAGLLLYFILRPRETLAEKYERELAEEAMLQDIEERQVCPVCHHKVVADFLVCPNCHTKLHKLCDNCGRVLNLRWNVCPYCAVPQAVPGGARLTAEPPPPPLPRREPSATPVPISAPTIATTRMIEPGATPVTQSADGNT